MSTHPADAQPKMMEATWGPSDTYPIEKEMRKKRDERRKAQNNILSTIANKEVHQALEDIFEDYEIMLSECAHLNSSFQDNWGIVTYEMDKMVEANATIRAKLREIMSSLGEVKRDLKGGRKGDKDTAAKLKAIIEKGDEALMGDRFGLFRPEGPLEMM
ncbi:hypothetical protein BKA70DRAFT_1236610 [Coprinopsis sp. MPI-PUGE-AT-0042]|nr:hypothetical protein BKA70DRAFT_1236610 [Coprinopsis sp. MPI-PUGE-AT-0042]